MTVIWLSNLKKFCAGEYSTKPKTKESHLSDMTVECGDKVVFMSF
jgi:hypothetical protein